MSAWMTTKTHISILAEYYANSGYSPSEYERIYLETFDLLNEANAESLKARYGDDPKGNLHSEVPGYFEASRRAGQFISVFGHVGILKACSCLEYQACEYDGWSTSKARKRLEAIRSEAIAKLPGYSEAPWGIDDKPWTDDHGSEAVRLV